MEAMGEREQASLQGHIMQHQEGFAEVRQANAFYLQSGQSQKLAIFGMPVSKLKKTHAKALLIGGGGDWGSQRGWSEMGNGSGVMMEDGREDMVLYQMQREFLECSDPRVFRLSTWNYTCGPLETDLETEWEFARCPIPGKAYPGQYGYAASGKMRRFGRPQTHANAHAIVSRTSIPLEQMLLREEARKAGLKPSEVLAIRLFTGPCHKVRFHSQWDHCLIGNVCTLPFLQRMLYIRLYDGAKIRVNLIRGCHVYVYDGVMGHSNSGSLPDIITFR